MTDTSSPLDLSEQQWQALQRDGFVVVHSVLPPSEVHDLNARLDDLMSGVVQHGDKLLMQLDPSALPSTTAPADLRAAAAAPIGVLQGDEQQAYLRARVEVEGQTRGFKGASRAYRKIGEAECGLECDGVFMSTMQKQLFRRVCDRVYGAHTGISVYRSMVMSKPAGSDGGGTALPWHQDGGEHWALDRDPLFFVWIALTQATKANGAVQVVKGSHKLGLLSRRGHTLSPEDTERVVGGGEVVDVELQPGDCFFCHNWTVHRSGINSTDSARRGFSINYIDARTRVLDPKPVLAGHLGTPGAGFPVVWPSPFG